jgi:hypothetical protein
MLSMRHDVAVQTEPLVSLECLVTTHIFTGYSHYECENVLRDILIAFTGKIPRSIADRAVGTRDSFLSGITAIWCQYRQL